MEDKDKKNIGEDILSNAPASLGLMVGGLWIVNFASSMYSFTYPMLSHLGNFASILSIFLLCRVLRNIRKMKADFTVLRCLRMSWLTSMYAALLTTFGQYIYFAYLDNGRLVNELNTLFENEEYLALMKEAFPEIDPTQALELISKVTVGEMVTNLLLFNLMIAVLFSLVSTIFGALQKYQHTGYMKQ